MTTTFVKNTTALVEALSSTISTMTTTVAKTVTSVDPAGRRRTQAVAAPRITHRSGMSRMLAATGCTRMIPEGCAIFTRAELSFIATSMVTGDLLRCTAGPALWATGLAEGSSNGAITHGLDA